MRCIQFFFFVKNFDCLKQSNIDGVHSCNVVVVVVVVAPGITSRRFVFVLFFCFLC